MVTRPFKKRSPGASPDLRAIRNHRIRRQRGVLAMECVAALGIFALAALPLSLAFLGEARSSRACHHRAATMEIVDGEMEILAAGEWRSFGTGRHDYAVTASAATNLPPGQFRLEVGAGDAVGSTRLRLAWMPADGRTNGLVVRERSVR